MSRITLKRIDLTTIASVDLGWAFDDTRTSDFMRARGKRDWLIEVSKALALDDCGFARPRFVDSAYARSREYGRPTFSAESRENTMPLCCSAMKADEHLSGCLRWSVSEIRFNISGVVSFHTVACLSTDWESTGGVSVDELIRSYHDFRRDSAAELCGIVLNLVRCWNESLPNYRLNAGYAQRSVERLESYDIVDLDCLVDGEPVKPKALYVDGPFEVVQELAGLSKMSAVYGHYDSEICARSLKESDLGNRDDEFWILNQERMIRYHPEHMNDLAKRLFFQDIITGLGVLMMQRSSLGFLISWVREQRSLMLGDLSMGNSSSDRFVVMQDLLDRLAWSADLYGELPAMGRTTSSTFFGAVMNRFSELKELRVMQGEIAGSISQVLEIAEAIFTERVAEQAYVAERQNLELSKAVRRVSRAALIVSVVSALLVAVQVAIAVFDGPRAMGSCGVGDQVSSSAAVGAEMSESEEGEDR